MLALGQPFFHWPLEFPEVFAAGGFDVVLSNPPWERIKLQEQEFFAARDARIATAASKAARSKLIAELIQKNPTLHAEFIAAVHAADCVSKFLRQSSRFPLTASGDINTYSVFAETARRILNKQGRAGVIVPTGISTDETGAAFFGDIVSKHHLAQLLDFKNSKGLFPAVDSNMRFCLLTLTAQPVATSTFAFFVAEVGTLRNRDRVLAIPTDLIALLNPNSQTCPSFWSRFDMELSRKIYQSLPILVHDGKANGNPWDISFLRMFDMSNDNNLFKSEPAEDYLRLYESKMFHHFNHRFASAGKPKGEKAIRGSSEHFEVEDLRDVNKLAETRYFVSAAETDARLGKYPFKWFIAFRNVTGVVANERTVVCAILPKVGVGNSAPLMLPATSDPRLVACLNANISSLIFDYLARQKVGGLNLNFFILEQLPVLPPTAYTEENIAFVTRRVVELTFTAWDLKAFANDILAKVGVDVWNQWFPENQIANGQEPSPYRWDEARRALLRAELDAWFARAYGLTRDELRYILDPADVHGPDFPGETFRVLKEKETAKFGEYRTRRLVLEAWDKLPTT